MVQIAEYKSKRNELMLKYENYVRSWLKTSGVNSYIADNMAFFRDGVVKPEIWFEETNKVRPLFILKEANTGIKFNDDSEVEGIVNEYNKKWGINSNDRSYFEFAEYEFDDIQIGKFKTWKKVVRAAIGLINDDDTYKTVDLNARYSSNCPKTEIPGYNQGVYKYRTGNVDYIDAVSRIAVIDIKKIGGGANVDSKLSKYGKTYLEHLDATKNLLIEQIKLIQPTVIVCCCGNDNEYVMNLLSSELSDSKKDIKWIPANHPGNSYKSDIEFCEPIIQKYRCKI